MQVALIGEPRSSSCSASVKLRTNALELAYSAMLGTDW